MSSLIPLIHVPIIHLQLVLGSTSLNLHPCTWWLKTNFQTTRTGPSCARRPSSRLTIHPPPSAARPLRRLVPQHHPLCRRRMCSSRRMRWPTCRIHQVGAPVVAPLVGGIRASQAHKCIPTPTFHSHIITKTQTLPESPP